MSTPGARGRVLLATIGTHGDVTAYLGLAAGLRCAGYDVVIATQERFRDTVGEHGVEFRPLPGDFRGDLEAASVDGIGSRSLLSALRSAFADPRRIAAALADAASGVDVIGLPTMLTGPGVAVADAAGVPSFGAYVVPVEPTGDFPPLVGRLPSLGRPANRAAGRLLRTLGGVATEQEVRAELGLPLRDRHPLHEELRRRRWPVVHGISPTLVPRPRDWRPELTTAGFWWPPPTTGPLAPEVERFLDAGEPPVYVGFGSMGAGHGPQLGRAVVDGLRRAGVRAVVARGWAALQIEPDDRILPVDEVPHDRLFGRVSVAVHHCGAGTTAAALRAGVPSVGVPSAADQHFWAGRLVRLGAGPRPVPMRRLTAGRLADAITAARSRTRFRDAADAASRQMATEDGTRGVVHVLEQLLQPPRDRTAADTRGS